jgi:hypothetical protein
VIQLDRPDSMYFARTYLVRMCRAGKLPAEVLSTVDRERLVDDLWKLGWSDLEIATHTKLSTYTATRIRSRIGRRPHPLPKGAAA